MASRWLEDPPPGSSQEEEEEEEEEEYSDNDEDGFADEGLEDHVRKQVQVTSSKKKASGTDAGSVLQDVVTVATTKTPAATSGTKRPAEIQRSSVLSKKKKEKGSGLFQRVWSEEDEIALLLGVLDFKTKRGSDPSAAASEFFVFVRESLQAEFTRTQVMDKIYKLKKRYQSNAQREQKGETLVFTKSHDTDIFHMSKKIWGPCDDANETEEAVKPRKRSSSRLKDEANVGEHKIKKHGVKSKSKAKAAVDRGILDDTTGNDRKTFDMDGDCEVEGNKSNENPVGNSNEVPVEKEVLDDAEEFWGKYPYLKEFLEFDKILEGVGLDKGFYYEKMRFLGDVKAKAMNERWMTLKLEAIELQAKKLDLVKEQMKLVSDAVRNLANQPCRNSSQDKRAI